MILVTGASGTIGSATVDALKRAGAPFKIGVRSLEKTKALGVEATHFDFDDPGSYTTAFKGVERVFLLTSATDRAHGYMLQAVAAAKRAGVKHLVRLSVVGADGEPGIILSRQHRCCEKELEQSGLAWTHLRPTFFSQNFVNYYGVDPKNGGTVYLPNGDGAVSWLDARDAGEVAARVLTGSGHESQVYTLTGPEALSTAAAADILARTLGKTVNYANVPEEAARTSMEGMGMPPWYVDGLLELHWVVRNGYAAQVADGVERVLGRPATSFAAYAKSLA